MKISRYVPQGLFFLYVIEAAVLGIAPADRGVWWAENITVWIPVAALLVMYAKGIRFSNTACFLMFLFFAMHTVGGHYTFEHVPMGPVTDFFGFRRNHFDRVCHFLVGVFAFPVLEYFEREKLVKGRRLLCFLVVMCIFGFAAIFELAEWAYAELADPQSGMLFLGSQGDVWDAQKDMLCDGLGAIVTTFFYCLLRPLPPDARNMLKKAAASDGAANFKERIR